MKKNLSRILFVFATFIFTNVNAQQEYDFNIPATQDTNFFQVVPEPENASRQLLYPKREFRCVWIATVYNIDYPSNTGLSVNTLKNEFISLMNKLKAAGINAAFVQIRPSCDAFYNSPYEPWSEWLTGTQGVAPSGGFDPLVFMIEEAHKRGIEFHAWLNPYRAVVSISSSSIASTHVSVVHPSWCVTYNSLKLLNPGLPEVRDYVKMVVADIVTRYNIDGIHFDDYFYPYPANGTTFNDNATFAAYPRGITNQNDWRRDNVNLLIGMINDTIKTIKPYVKFGVGPFGIWKSGVPPGITGLSSYSAIYCDPIAWLNNQDIDYVAPQLYWKIGTNQDFNTLVDWWGTQASNKNRHCYAGMASYLLDPNNSNWAINDILNQITSARQINFKAQGQSFFSATSVKDNLKHLADSLSLSFNKYKCLIPAMPWLDSIAPLPPANVSHTITSFGVTLNWQLPAPATDADTAKYFVIYRSTDGSAVDITDSRQILYISPEPIITYNDTLTLSSYPGVAYAITSCDKLHNESSVEYINVTITPPANDNCMASQNISPAPGCSPVSGDLLFTSASGNPAAECDNFSNPALQDVWFSFIATDTIHKIKINPGGDMDAVLSLYSGCGSTELSCADNSGPGSPDSLTATGLTVGNTYHVRIYDYGSIAPSTTTFNICITGPDLSTSIKESQIRTVELYPNPFDGTTLYDKVTNSTNELIISVQNILGQVVLTKTVVPENGSFSLNFSESLQSGVYLVSVHSTHSNITKKVVVRK
jgi:uncharacterized lipoprotein YddW (UPF0748 family)